MLICLDYDGVLVDSFDVLLDMARRAQSRLGVGRPPTAADFRTIENLAFPDLGLRIGLSARQVDAYMEALFELQRGDWPVRLFPGVAAALETLASRNVLVVVTASQGEAVLEMLSRSGVAGSIAGVMGGELGLSKAQRISMACTRHQLDVAETVMVGDAISDIRQGREAGVLTAAVAWGYQDRELLEREDPDVVLETTADLGALCETLGAVA